MAKKKLVFDPNEDPNTGYDKWTQEYLRLMDAGPVNWNAGDESAVAREHMKYFKTKLNKPESEKGPRFQTYQPPKKKKPWPGWEKVVEKL
jgi:hypothetical protein